MSVIPPHATGALMRALPLVALLALFVGCFDEVDATFAPPPSAPPPSDTGDTGDTDTVADTDTAADTDTDTAADTDTGPDTACTMAYYTDADADGFGGAYAGSACTAPPGTVLDNTDCDDANAFVFPGAPEITDGVDNNCDGTVDESATVDADGDGYPEADDCNDRDPSINPGATELSGDRIDNDCDGVVDAVGDGDGDGYTIDEDCDDTNPAAYPGAAEVRDGVDNDCDGSIDE